MGTKYPDLFAALSAPIPKTLLKSRPQGGRQLTYITARTAMIRLDEVLGPENWWDEYSPMENSVLCRLTIRLPDGTTLTKADAGGYAGMSDQGDDDKSGYSDAFKRACVKFGIARELYQDGAARFDTGSGTETPQQAPQTPPQATHEPRRDERPSEGGESPYGSVPRSCRAMFPWMKAMEEKWGDGLVKHMNSWAKDQGFPFKTSEWDEGQFQAGVKEACRAIDHVRGVGDGYEQAA